MKVFTKADTNTAGTALARFTHATKVAPSTSAPTPAGKGNMLAVRSGETAAAEARRPSSRHTLA